VVEHCGQTQRKECSVGRRRWIKALALSRGPMRPRRLSGRSMP
jgi:hypothetical protein